MTISLDVNVDGQTPAESQRFTVDLIDYLTNHVSDASIQRKKTEPNTMDLGATITIIATSAAATAIASGLKIWLAKNQDARITISEHGAVIARGLTSNDAVKIVDLFSKRD